MNVLKKENNKNKNTNVNNTNKVVSFPEVWMEKLSRTNDGKIKNTIPNYVLILKNDKEYKDRLRLNEHSKRVEIKDKASGKYHGLLNIDMSRLKNHIEDKYNSYNKDKLNDAIDIVASENGYHPIKQYIESLKWDGIKRIDTAFADYFGAEVTPYNAMCMKLILLGAIERIYEPGCKFDVMVIIKRYTRSWKIYLF